MTRKPREAEPPKGKVNTTLSGAAYNAIATFRAQVERVLNLEDEAAGQFDRPHRISIDDAIYRAAVIGIEVYKGREVEAAKLLQEKMRELEKKNRTK